MYLTAKNLTGGDWHSPGPRIGSAAVAISGKLSAVSVMYLYIQPLPPAVRADQKPTTAACSYSAIESLCIESISVHVDLILTPPDDEVLLFGGQTYDNSTASDSSDTASGE
jgi:hypothetical protein